MFRVGQGMDGHTRAGVQVQCLLGQCVGLPYPPLFRPGRGEPARPRPAVRACQHRLPLHESVAVRAVGRIPAGGEGSQHQPRHLVGRPPVEVQRQMIGREPVLPVRVQEHPVHQARLPLPRGQRVAVRGHQLLLQRGVVQAVPGRQGQQRPRHTAARLLGHPLAQQRHRPPAQRQHLPHRRVLHRLTRRHSRLRPRPLPSGQTAAAGRAVHAMPSVLRR